MLLRLFHRECLIGFWVEGRGFGVQRHGRADYVGAALSPVAMVRNKAASGQAEAKATRMRVAVSMTRAATLSSRRRRVANSALASAADLGIACWMRHMSQYAAVWRINRIWFALTGALKMREAYGGNGSPSTYFDPLTNSVQPLITNFRDSYPAGVTTINPRVNALFSGIGDFLNKQRRLC